ncbi:GNAT family N-acetyltransferase [Neobacillus niacini]
MSDSKVEIIKYKPNYAKQTVEMWRNSKEAALGQKEIHSFGTHVDFLNQILVEKYQVDLALIDEKVVGIIAYNKKEISQLYIHIDYQGIGIGQKLLARAKEQSTGRLTLFTFEVNKKAQRFYEKHGFKIVGKGYENEEGLPDILYEWKHT